MIGSEDPFQPSLFYTSFNLDKRIHANHPLRQVAKGIVFGFVSDEGEYLYGTNGNVSVPPPVILKLLVLLMLYNVRSEREMMDTLPERSEQGASPVGIVQGQRVSVLSLLARFFGLNTVQRITVYENSAGCCEN